LALGETVYFTGIPYDQFGTAGQTVQAKKTRETIAATKTIRFAAASFTPYFNAVLGTDYTVDSDGSVRVINGKSPFVSGSFYLPDGCTVTSFAAEMWQEYGWSVTLTDVSLYLAGATTPIVDLFTFAAGGAAWFTLTGSLSQSTTGQAFRVVVGLGDFYDPNPGDGHCRVRTIEVTYTTPNTERTI